MLLITKNWLRRESFLVTPLSIVFNPLYIIRRGLLKGISKVAQEVRGDVLDFGCGSKPYVSLFKGATSYVGVDIQTSGHNHKESKVDIFYDGKALPFADGHFDAVVCFEVFEHIFNIEEVLSEIRRVLKDGGQLVVSVPFAWEEHEVPYDFARYTSYGIAHVFQKSGFEIVELKKTTTYVLAMSQLFIAYLYQYVLPTNRILGWPFRITIIFPLNLIALLLNSILPKRYEYFCNCVVHAIKGRSQY